jgi:hypothetical protein
MEEDYGPWEALSPGNVAAIFSAYRGRWWLGGGWAIELFVGRPLRPHEDIDIEILRSEVYLVHEVLEGWEVHACRWPNGDVFHLWDGDELLPPDVHDLWCRPGPDAPWGFQFMVLDDDGDRWTYRRDARIGGAMDELTVVRGGIPLLAPEVQLLYKSKGRRPKDEIDFAAALPLLGADRTAWLREALAISDPANPWLERLHA